MSRTGAPAPAPAAGVALGRKGGAASPAQSKKQGSKGVPAAKGTSAPEPGASPGLTSAQSRTGQGSSKTASKPAATAPKGLPGQPMAQGKKEGKKEPAKHAGAPAPGRSAGHTPAQGKKEGKKAEKEEPAAKHAGAPAPVKSADQKPASGTKGAKKEPTGKHAGAPAPGGLSAISLQLPGLQHRAEPYDGILYAAHVLTIPSSATPCACHPLVPCCLSLGSARLHGALPAWLVPQLSSGCQQSCRGR